MLLKKYRTRKGVRFVRKSYTGSDFCRKCKNGRFMLFKQKTKCKYSLSEHLGIFKGASCMINQFEHQVFTPNYVYHPC